MKKILIVIITLISFKGMTQEISCPWDDGLYRYYVKLITDAIPTSDFDNTDFMNHLIANSNPPNAELDFLNGSISGVTMSFPSSMNDELRKVVTVACDYDSMDVFLTTYTESIEYVEFYCPSALGIESFKLENVIKIYPNPISENSRILIDDRVIIKSLDIIDITGKQIISEKISDEKVILLSRFNLTNGVYFLRFLNDKLSITKKIIVNQ